MNYESDYIKKLYNNLDIYKQIEISKNILEAIKEDLIEMLEKKILSG